MFDTAVQIPRPRAQHGAVTWRHAIGARADIVLLAHYPAFEAIGGCARQKVTCTFSNAAVVPLLESPPLHRSRHSIWSCLFFSGATAANATSKNSGFTLPFLAHDHYTSWTRELKEKSCAKKKARKSERPVPYDWNRRPPTCRSHCAKRSMFPNRDYSKDVFSLNTAVEIETSVCFINDVFIGPRIPPCLSRRLPDQPTLVVGKLWSDILRAVIQDFLSVCQAYFPRALQKPCNGHVTDSTTATCARCSISILVPFCVLTDMSTAL